MGLAKILLVLTAILASFAANAKTSIESYLIDVDLLNVTSGINQIDCVYVINLDQRMQKWVDVKNMFHSYGIYPNRVRAVNGWKLSEGDKHALMGSYPLRLRGGQIGCILSHISTLRDSFKRGYDVVWVCEDDIWIHENPHQLSELICELFKTDPNWDILYTDSDSKNKRGEVLPSVGSDFRQDLPHENLSYYVTREILNKDLVKVNQRFGAYSLIFSKRGIEKVLRYFTSNYLWTAYDIDIHYIPGIREYCIRRDVVSIDWKKPSDTERDYQSESL